MLPKLYHSYDNNVVFLAILPPSSVIKVLISEVKNLTNVSRTKKIIKHVTITFDIPRGNGQTERNNSLVISLISETPKNKSNKCLKYVFKVEKVINFTYQKNIKNTPFELLFCTKTKQTYKLLTSQKLQSRNNS